MDTPHAVSQISTASELRTASLLQSRSALEHQEQLVERMGHYFSPGKHFYIRVDFSDSLQDRVSPGGYQMLALEPHATYSEIRSHYHPEDRDILAQQEHVISQFYAHKIEPLVYRFYKVMNMVRLQLRDGSYHRFIKQRVLLELTRDYRPRSAMFTYVDVEAYGIPIQHKLHFLHMEGGKSYRNVVLNKEPEFVEQQLRQLSQRQKEVLQLLAMGYAQKEVAEMLHLSFNTVRTLRQRALKKLEAKNLNQAIYIAIKQGLIH
ncbi:MAG: response regulator transcription factor [Bacteroidota bacterium]